MWIIFLGFLASFFCGNVDDDTECYRWRTQINITNPGSTSLDAIPITINTNSLRGSQRILSSTCNDIRFKTLISTGDWDSEVDFWMESPCGTSETHIWLDTTLDASEKKTIYMYSGCETASFSGDDWGGDNYFVVLSGSSSGCPSGFTSYDTGSGFFLGASSTDGFGTTTGEADSNSHSHGSITTLSPITPDVTPEISKVTYQPMVDYTYSDHRHQLVDVGISGEDTFPPYRRMQLCKSGWLSYFEDAVVVMDSVEASSFPSGWSRYSHLDNRFVYITDDVQNVGVEGGALDHSHTASGTTLATLLTKSEYLLVYQNQVNMCLQSHTHPFTLTTSAADSLPPYTDVIFASTTSTSMQTESGAHFLVIASASPPFGFDEVTSDLGDNLLRGATSYGATGGGEEHTHTYGVTFDGTTAPCAQETDTIDDLVPGAGKDHIHNEISGSAISGAEASTTIEVPSFSVKFYKRKQITVTLALGETNEINSVTVSQPYQIPWPIIIPAAAGGLVLLVVCVVCLCICCCCVICCIRRKRSKDNDDMIELSEVK